MTDAAATQRGPSDWIAWALSSILLAVLLVILLWIFYPELLHPSEPEPDVRISALAALLAQIPLRRLGTPDDVAQTVLFLLGDGGRYITGQVLHVNGGMYM